MHTIMRSLALLPLLVGVAWASQEDFAPITKLELTAKTTRNTFGTVVVQAEAFQAQNGTGLSSLKVVANGKTLSVPRDVLAKVARPAFMTTTISSEVGYPDSGIGPFLYVGFLGHDGTEPCRFRMMFDRNGFREMKKEDPPTKH